MYDSLISLPPVYLLLEGILDKLKKAIAESLFEAIKTTCDDMVNVFQKNIGDLSSQLSSSPQGWNKAAYDLVKTIQDNAVIPVAMLILVFVFCYEFISLVAKKNTGQEVDVQEFFVIFGKTTFGIVFITHAWEIVMALFDLASHMITKAANVISPQMTDPAQNIMNLAQQYLKETKIGGLFTLLLISFIARIIAIIIGILATYVVMARMLEIYIMSAVAPLHMGSMFNREFTGLGQNYLKSMFALGLQGLFMLITIALFQVLTFPAGDGPWGILLQFSVSGIILIGMLFKSGSIAKSVMGAH